jgi:hypothetical protein
MGRLEGILGWQQNASMIDASLKVRSFGTTNRKMPKEKREKEM